MTVEFTSPTITFLEPGMALNFEIELELELPIGVTLEANLGVTVSTTHGTGVGNASMFFNMRIYTCMSLVLRIQATFHMNGFI